MNNKFLIYLFVFVANMLFYTSCNKEQKIISVEESFLYDYAGYCSVNQNGQEVKPFIYGNNEDGKINLSIDQYWTGDNSPYRNIALSILHIPSKEGYVNLNDDSTFIGLITYKYGYDLIDGRYQIKTSSDNYVNITEVTNQSIKGFFQLVFERDTSIKKNHVPFLSNIVVYENGFFDCVLD